MLMEVLRQGQTSSLTQVKVMAAQGGVQRSILCSNKTVDTPIEIFIALYNGKLIFLKISVAACWLLINLRFSGITVGWTL